MDPIFEAILDSDKAVAQLLKKISGFVKSPCR